MDNTDNNRILFRFNSEFELDAFDLAGFEKLKTPPPFSEAKVVYLTMEEANVNIVDLPGKRNKDWFSALKYELDDLLIEDVNDLHIVVLGDDPNGNPIVFSTLKTNMDKWNEILSEKGVHDYILVPDYFSIPFESNLEILRYSITGDSIVRLKNGTGFSGKKRLIESFISNKYSDLVKELPGQNVLDSSIHAFKKLKNYAVNNSKKHVSREGGLKGRTVSVIAMVSICLSFLFMTYVNYKNMTSLDGLSEKYHTASIKLFKELFPNIPKIVSLKAQAEREITQLKKGYHPFKLTVIAKELNSPILASSITVRRVLYKGKNELVLSVDAKSKRNLTKAISLLSEFNSSYRYSSLVLSENKGKVKGEIHVVK